MLLASGSNAFGVGDDSFPAWIVMLSDIAIRNVLFVYFSEDDRMGFFHLGISWFRLTVWNQPPILLFCPWTPLYKGLEAREVSRWHLPSTSRIWGGDSPSSPDGRVNKRLWCNTIRRKATSCNLARLFAQLAPKTRHAASLHFVTNCLIRRINSPFAWHPHVIWYSGCAQTNTPTHALSL